MDCRAFSRRLFSRSIAASAPSLSVSSSFSSSVFSLFSLLRFFFVRFLCLLCFFLSLFLLSGSVPSLAEPSSFFGDALGILSSLSSSSSGAAVLGGAFGPSGERDRDCCFAGRFLLGDLAGESRDFWRSSATGDGESLRCCFGDGCGDALRPRRGGDAGRSCRFLRALLLSGDGDFDRFFAERSALSLLLSCDAESGVRRRCVACGFFCVELGEAERDSLRLGLGGGWSGDGEGEALRAGFLAGGGESYPDRRLCVSVEDRAGGDALRGLRDNWGLGASGSDDGERDFDRGGFLVFCSGAGLGDDRRRIGFFLSFGGSSELDREEERFALRLGFAGVSGDEEDDDDLRRFCLRSFTGEGAFFRPRVASGEDSDRRRFTLGDDCDLRRAAGGDSDASRPLPFAFCGDDVLLRRSLSAANGDFRGRLGEGEGFRLSPGEDSRRRR